MKIKWARKRIVYTFIVTMIVVFSTTFAILMTLERTDYRNYLQGEYSKNMYQLIDSVQNIRVNLAKAPIVGSKEQGITIFEEIFRHSTMANDKLHSLPVSQQITGNTSKFLSQVGDFCYVLAKSSSEGNDLSDQDYKNIDRLKQESFVLEQQLKAVSDDVNSGNLKWGEIRKKVTGVLAKNGGEEGLADVFQGIQKQVSQYPALIYDGPFSDNVLDIKPKINSQDEVSQTKAEDVVKNLIGKDKIDSIKLKPNEGKGKIDCYRFAVTLKNKNNKGESIDCQISKRGGKVLYLLDNRTLGNPTMDAKKAVEVGTKYLKDIGYKNMYPTYFLNYGNSVVISYVYNERDVIMYPDQIKLKIALDNGRVIGIESEKYLVAHEENRELKQPKITQEKAQERVGKRLNIKNVRLALIPSETNKEILCYEFSGNYKNDNFKIYINAETGYEEKIVQIINTPNGELTM